jgi:hypothetical protein
MTDQQRTIFPVIANFSETEPAGGLALAEALSVAAGLVAGSAGAARESWREAGAAGAQARALQRRVVALSTQNAVSYSRARELLRGGSAAPAGDRDRELGDAVAAAAGPPLALAGCAADVAQLAAEVAERGVPELRADLVVAAMLAAAAAAAAAHLVEVNLVVGGRQDAVEAARRLAAIAGAARDRCAQLP